MKPSNIVMSGLHAYNIICVNMGAIQLYNNETFFSNSFRRRLQNSTERTVDSVSTCILDLFIQNYKDKIDEFLRYEEMNEAEQLNFLTVKVSITDMGVQTGKNPARAISHVRVSLKTLNDSPYVIRETVEGGIRKYHSLPLLKYSKIDEEGNCTFVFNDMLRFHISPKKRFTLCDLDTLKEIKKKSICAGIIYEEACSWANNKDGKTPYFDWSTSELRQKLLYDKISEISPDGTSITVIPQKKMRIDHLIRNVLKPALEVLEDFFSKGKITFWVEMITYLTETKKRGRPPKNSFHFVVRKKKRAEETKTSQDVIQPDLFGYEEINNYTEIKKELRIILDSKSFVSTIIKQIQDREAEDSLLPERALTIIRNARANYSGKKGKVEWRNLLLAILWEEEKLGKEPSKKKEVDSKDADPWPETLDEKIEAMKQCYEICDRATREHNLSQEETLSRLDINFRAFCHKYNKPLKNWKDATELFFNVINKPWFLKYNDYDNNRVSNADKRIKSNLVEEEALRYFDHR